LEKSPCWFYRLMLLILSIRVLLMWGYLIPPTSKECLKRYHISKCHQMVWFVGYWLESRREEYLIWPYKPITVCNLKKKLFQNWKKLLFLINESFHQVTFLMKGRLLFLWLVSSYQLTIGLYRLSIFWCEQKGVFAHTHVTPVKPLGEKYNR